MSRELKDMTVEAVLTHAGVTKTFRLTEGDLELEYRYQKERFEERPEMKGVRFEDIVKQTTGMDVAEWRQSRAFRVKASAALLGRRAITQEQLLEGYEKFVPPENGEYMKQRALEFASAG